MGEDEFSSAAPAETAEELGRSDRGAVGRRRFLGLAAAAAAAGLGSRAALAARPRAAGEEPTETASPGKPAQWAMVIDLARCDGCGLCTSQCQKTHFTGSQEWIQVFRIEDADGGHHFLPRPCMHCGNAPCLNVCPVGATFRDEHGMVLINHDRCIGCRLCMAACPYGARSFNWGEPENPPGASLANYSPQYPVPHRKGTAEKCMLCAHETRDGKLPACASSCPMNAIWLADLDRNLATNGIDTAKLSWLLQNRDAFRLKEELGTRPRVWYLPGHGQSARGEPRA